MCSRRDHREAAVKTVLIIAVVAALATGLGVWVGWEVARQEERARGVTTLGHLTTFEVYFHDYHKKYGYLPPAYLADRNGIPMHSWRVLLLEFIDPSLYAAYDFREPWNGPNNRLLSSRMPTCYAAIQPGSANTVFTSYVVITGERTPFPGANPRSFRDIKDPANTILVAEIVNSNIHWMEPRDLSITTMSFALNDSLRPSISTGRRGGPGALFADGRKQLLDPSTPPDALKAMLVITDKKGRPLGR